MFVGSSAVHDDYGANADGVWCVAQIVFLEVVNLVSGLGRGFQNGLNKLSVKEGWPFAPWI